VLRGPPVTLNSQCGERAEVPYGEEWRCPACGRSYDTARIPREDYVRIRRTQLRFRILPVAYGVFFSARARPLAVYRTDRERQNRSSDTTHRTNLSSDEERQHMAEKTWGGEPFWGLGYDWDPDWVLTERQRELRETLIGLCESEMRANAKRSDDELLYPRRNFELLAEHGFLSLTVPEDYGGLGENHVAFAMACETLARYGCASTAMCYVMHIGAVATIMLRPTPELVDRYIRPLDKEVRIGTLSYSDPETGSHFWYPVSSGAEASNGGYKVRKKASWTTSGGFADFYVVQTTSPEFTGYDDLSVFVIDGDDVKAQPSLWDALGLRGNQSGPIEVDNVEIPADQVVGPLGDGANSNDEAVDPWFLVGSSSVWNGIALGAIDIAKRHTTRKKHVDVGMRVADYPTIQDYIGEAVMDTNASRIFVFSVAQAMDRATDDNTKVLKPGETARADYLHWAWQIKFEAAKNVAHVVDKMLHACGGSGYKRDMELERYLRDAKAGWVMGPTNEVLRQFVGKAVLLGFDALDYWNQTYNRRVVENELKKLDSAGKRELAEQLVEQAEQAEGAEPAKA
jgi:alkylation response protein AidB-like acyl-CoA dehydrogenase